MKKYQMALVDLTEDEQETALKLLRQFIYCSLQEGNPIPNTTTISIHREGQLYRTIEFPTPIDFKGRIRLPIFTRVALISLMSFGIVGLLMLMGGIALLCVGSSNFDGAKILVIGWGLLCFSLLVGSKLFEKVESETELVKSYFGEEYNTVG